MSSLQSDDNGKKSSVGTIVRTITSVVTLPFLILPIYFGDIYIYILLFLLTFVGQYEVLRGVKVDRPPIIVFMGVNSLLYYILLYFDLRAYFLVVLTGFVVVLLIYYVLTYPFYSFSVISQVVTTFIYVNVMLSYIILIRMNGPYGRWFVWLVFLISFGSDTFAYFVGRHLGKHKLAEKLSPKKTVEGAIGGTFGAIILTVLYGVIMHRVGVLDDLSKIGYLVLLGGAGSVLSILGDLVASGIKRQNGIKDFGHILPGHGGIMDRFDSNIFTAPLVYYIMVYYFL